MRSVYAPAVLALGAVIASLARWALQGSGNLYTALDKRFYVPDPDLGWRIAPEHPIWLGLEVCAIVAAIAAGLAVAGWLVRKVEARRGAPLVPLRAAGWIVAAVAWAPSLAAFASGGSPAGARDVLPATDAVSLETGISGALAAPAGRYRVIAHEGSVITARVSAGGESFDARFSGDLAGVWEGDPKDLNRSMRAEISVATASVDTGIGGRSKSARESYLQAAKYPRLTFTLGEVIATRQDTPSQLAFRARGTLGLIGRSHPVEVTGTIARPDAAGLSRLGLEGDILRVQASFSIPIAETALAPDAGDFDGDRIPVHVSLILKHTEST